MAKGNIKSLAGKKNPYQSPMEHTKGGKKMGGKHR